MVNAPSTYLFVSATVTRDRREPVDGGDHAPLPGGIAYYAARPGRQAELLAL